jgi:nitroimidazol reductase NimA-like FMN-containing flavoprotein (pyridoxamine 5'-phosphate oxidase superfamily)
MLIQEMNPAASVALLQESHLGRLACARGAQPYITPFSFAYHQNVIYSFATLGQRIAWMRENPLVCAEVDAVVDARNWRSVIVFGRFVELPDEPAFRDQRVLAHQLLARTASWWEPGYVKSIVAGVERRLVPIYFKIVIDDIRGHTGTSGASHG